MDSSDKPTSPKLRGRVPGAPEFPGSPPFPRMMLDMEGFVAAWQTFQTNYGEARRQQAEFEERFADLQRVHEGLRKNSEDRIQSLSADAQRRERDLEALRKRLAQATDETKAANARAELAMNQSTHLERELARVVRERAEETGQANARYAQARAEITRLNGRIEESRAQNAAAAARALELDELRSGLESRLQSEEKRAGELIADRERATAHAAALEKDRAEVRGLLAGRESQLKTQEIQLRSLESRIQQGERAAEALRLQLVQSTESLRQSEADREGLRQRLAVADGERREHAQEAQRLSRELSERKEELLVRCERLATERDHIAKELRALEGALANQLSAAHQRTEHALGEKTQLGDRLAQVERERDELRTQIARDREAHRIQGERERAEERALAERGREELRAQTEREREENRAQAERERAELRAQVEGGERERAELRAQVERAERECAELRARLDAAGETLDVNRRAAELEQARATAERDEAKEARRRAESALVELAQARSQVADAQREMKDAHDAIRKLRGAVPLRAILDLKEHQVRETERELAALGADHPERGAVESLLEGLREERTEIRRTLGELAVGSEIPGQ